MVPIPTPRFPFLASGASTQASYLLSLEAKAKPAHLSLSRGSRLRYWLHPSHASAHLWERASKPLHFELGCSLPNPTIAAAQARVKGIDYDICVLPHILSWDTAQEVSIAPIGVFECIKLQIVGLALLRTPPLRSWVNRAGSGSS